MTDKTISLAARRAHHHDTDSGDIAVTHFLLGGKPRVVLGVMVPNQPDTAAVMTPAQARKIGRSLLYAADAAQRLAP